MHAFRHVTTDNGAVQCTCFFDLQMIDLFYFVIVLLVFIAAYGIASQVILYPNQPLNIKLARDVLSTAWWNVFGQFNIDEVSGIVCYSRPFLALEII